MATLREQAHELVNKYSIDTCFSFLERHLKDNDLRSKLKLEFIAGESTFDFSQRLHVLIDELIDAKTAGDKNFAKFIAKEVPIIEDHARINQRNENNQDLDTDKVLADKSSEHLYKKTLQAFFAKERTKIVLGQNSKAITQQEKLRRLTLADNGHIYKGTLLSFGEYAEVNKVCLSASQSKFAYFRGIERKNSIPIQTEIIYGNLLQQYERMIKLLQDNIPLERNRALDKDEFEVPIEALSELVANAYVHRDYSTKATQIVSVEIFDDRIEIKNAGKIPDSVDVYDVQESILQNPTIMGIFYMSGYVERMGTGINKARLAFQEKGLQDIVFKAEPNEVLKVIVYRNKLTSQTFTSTLPVFLSHLPSPTSHFIGRKEELQTLHANLQAGKRTILINGLGGVGKTTLVQKYAHDYQTEYAHILYIRQGIHLIASFFMKDLYDNLGLEIETQETAVKGFANMLAKLRQLQGKNLLVIDNYEPTETDQTQDTLGQLFALPTNWRVVFTSRVDVPIFDKTLRLDVLPPDEAIEVFRQHAVGKPLDDTEIDTLLHMIGYHMLMTELLAKTYRESMYFESVGKLYNFLQRETLHHQKLQEDIYIGTQETTLFMHLQTVFSLASLTEAETWLLKQWAVLPTALHQASDFLTWIQDTDLTYEKPLKALAKKSWLQTEDNLAYALHPLLQLFLHEELKPTLPDCEKMWDYFTDLMILKEVEANPSTYQWTIAIGEAMAQHIDYTNHEKKQGVLWDRIHRVYKALGDYPNAIRCAKQSVTFIEVAVGKQHKSYASALNNVAFLYDSVGNYAEALPLYEEVLQIRKEVLGERHLDYAQSLNDLAVLYYNQENYTKALPLYEEALQICEETLGKQHPHYASALHNLASLYHQQENYADALVLYEEASQIQKNALGKQHPDYAISLNNLAGLYYEQGNYAKALPLYEEAAHIQKEIVGNRHADYALSLHNIGALYFEQENYTQARTYLEEAYSIFLEKVGEQHPHTKNAKEWLDNLPL